MQSNIDPQHGTTDSNHPCNKTKPKKEKWYQSDLAREKRIS